MDKDIITIHIENELDVVLAYKRGMQLSGFCGLAVANQTKFATAVSEVCRNVLEHVGQGQIKFNLAEEKGRLYLQAVITDRGRGISNLPAILKQLPGGAKGWGLYNSQKLVDYFDISSNAEKGTRVQLRKVIPSQTAGITNAVIRGWIENFDQEKEISPYAEIKNQNMQLIQLLDALREKNIQAENQLEEIKRLNEELRTSNQEINLLLQERILYNEQLVKINQELDQFAHVVSHDLKAPLYNVIALSGIIEECLESDNKTEAIYTINMLNEEASQLDKLISDILSYSTTGRHNITKTPVNLNELVQRLLASFKIKPETRITIQPDLPTLLSEEIYLQQVFGNLLSNALKYCDKSNGVIQVSFRQVNQLLEFAITDNGPGIPLADQDKIFRIFETSSLHRNTSSGIGLSIVDKIIKLKGTAIWVESKGSAGSTFKFTWPAGEQIIAMSA
jgi:signal transduction histidine kinase